MGDLKRHFRPLDRLEMPDIWREVERRGPVTDVPAEQWPVRRLAIVLLAMAVAAAGLAVAVKALGGRGSAEPASTITNGRIAFSGVGGGGWQVYSVEPDGGGLTQLTHVSDQVAESPAWSPDGTKIAYVVDENGGNGPSNIWVMNADGSDPERLTDGPGSSWSPAWSPDSTRIAFARGDPSNIYVVNADGTDLTKLTKGQGCWSDPAWSPDGSMIVFDQNGGECQKDLYVVNGDGTGQRRLLALPDLQTEPAWSPDGSTIAFTNISQQGGGSGISAMDPTGGNVRPLTEQPGAQHAAWSPDAKQIVFMAIRPGTDHDALFVMNADGTDAHELPGLPIEATFPSWQPVPPSSSPTPSHSPTPSPSELVIGDTHMPPGFVREIVLPSSGSHLVLQAPPGRIRWSLDGETCTVRYSWLVIPAGGTPGGGGGGGAACPWAPHLSIGATGTYGSNGALFSVIGGHVIPAIGVRVRVRLANGSQTTVEPQHSMWLVVVQRCGDYEGTSITSVELLGNDGSMIDKKSFPPETGSTCADG